MITGEGPAFCAGADINEFADIQGLGALPDEYGSLLTALRSATKPTIAAVRGAAAGIGVALALCCDLRLATPDAFFRLAFVDIGLTVDGGSTWLLPRIIGAARTLELATRDAGWGPRKPNAGACSTASSRRTSWRPRSGSSRGGWPEDPERPWRR